MNIQIKKYKFEIKNNIKENNFFNFDKNSKEEDKYCVFFESIFNIVNQIEEKTRNFQIKFKSIFDFKSKLYFIF